MESLSIGVLASSALGMAAALLSRGEGGEAIRDAYNALRDLVASSPGSSVGALEEEPASADRQRVVADQIELLSEGKREEVLKLCRLLVQRLSESSSDKVGVDNQKIEALKLEIDSISMGGVDISYASDYFAIYSPSTIVARSIFKSTSPLLLSTTRGNARRFALVPVWYATDRKPTGLTEPAAFFSAERGDLSYGVAEVTIPIDRPRMGELEQPSFWRLEFSEDPTRHVLLASITPKREATFYRHLRRRIEKTNGKQAFVFVHGYNVDFKDAARRAGQMAWDLNFDGAPILYSWPSQARVKAYSIDSTNAEWTVAHFEQFLRKLAQLSGARTINLIGHSMGNRPLLYALQRFSRDITIFREIVLAAPDIDTEVFMRLAEEIRNAGHRTTLYASSRDRALQLSKRFNGYPRAGDTSDRIAVIDGIETVDASAVNTNLIGHSYYGGSRSVLSDIFYVMRGIAVRSRVGIRPSPDNSYWIFQP